MKSLVIQMYRIIPDMIAIWLTCLRLVFHLFQKVATFTGFTLLKNFTY